MPLKNRTYRTSLLSNTDTPYQRNWSAHPNRATIKPGDEHAKNPRFTVHCTLGRRCLCAGNWGHSANCAASHTRNVFQQDLRDLRKASALRHSHSAREGRSPWSTPTVFGNGDPTAD